MKKFLNRLLFVYAITSLAGCANSKADDSPSELGAFDIKATTVNNTIRLQALQDAATSLGAQGALAWRGQRMNNKLMKNKDHLNGVFNFRAMMLDHDVLPPVLVEAQDTLNLDGDSSIRLADQTYKIISPARFVTAPPIWRDYLWMNFKKPGPPDATLLPKNDDERATWNKYVQIGWENGLQQANQIFSANLSRLKRDYQGMVLYRKLLAQNMVSEPFVAKTELGITGDEKSMRLNDRVLRITANSKLKPDSKEWNPIVRKNQD